MEYFLIIFSLIGCLFGLYFFLKKQIESNSQDNKKQIESKLDDFVEAFKLESAKNLADQIKDSKQDQKNMSDALENVTKELQKIKGTNEQVLTFANQMKTLEKILGNQKQRGILGEIQLENLLANVLPPELFQMQYSFSNNEAVDAIIKVGEFIIPIDAKFSLDNYNKMIEGDETDIDGYKIQPDSAPKTWSFMSLLNSRSLPSEEVAPSRPRAAIAIKPVKAGDGNDNDSDDSDDSDDDDNNKDMDNECR